MIKAFFKSLMVRLVSNRFLIMLLSPLMHRHIPVFMLHRINDPAYGLAGHSIESIRTALEYLKKHGYTFISLEDLIEGLNGRLSLPSRGVVFTMDDGFYEQASLAVPIFQEYGCPVTIFLLPDFVDGKLWPWDYQLSYIFVTTNEQSISLDDEVISCSYSISCEQEKRAALRAIRDELKTKTTDEAIRTTHKMARLLNVEISETPPDAYKSISWETARSLEGNGVSFGPHTANHTILMHQSEEVSRHQISYSWERLKQELRAPVPVFCYPTGRKNIDFGCREVAQVKEAGFSAALSTDPGYVNLAQDGNDDRLFQLKRFGFPDEFESFVQLASGVERLNEIKRGGQ